MGWLVSRAVTTTEDTKVMSSAISLEIGGYKDMKRSLHSTVTHVTYLGFLRLILTFFDPI